MSNLWLGTTWAELMEWLPMLLQAFVINLQVTALTLLIGLPGGFLLALGLQSRRRAVSVPTLALVELGRGAPALVLVQFVYFGLPQVSLTIGSFSAAVVALALSCACYTSEIIRSGLDAVARGQKEAAHALNLSAVDEMRFIVLPQALRISTPALLGFAILVLQSTTLCFTIALPEIVAQAYEIGSISFRYFPVLLLTAMMFVVVCVPASVAVGWLESKTKS
jgi:polar amino acid transport system permease protein